MNLIKSWSKLYIEAGCDEVGRGCLCGPVVAAAVIIDENFNECYVNDSKKLSANKRIELDQYIRNHAVDFALAELPPSYIDKYNILQSSIHAMHFALDQLSVKPELILVDGNKFNSYQAIPHECIIKGDGKVASIAAASILAKIYRDNIMIRLHDEYPEYGWNRNMGYATKNHREALKKYGPTKYHRQSFRLDYR